MHRHVTLCTAT